MQALDYIVVSFYLITVVAIGYLVGRREKSLDQFLLGSRKMNWVAVMISFYATAASALTFIGVPAQAFSTNFSKFVLMVVGGLIGRFLIAIILIPNYFREKVATVYQLIYNRLGLRAHLTVTTLFMITRLLASGVRLAGCAIAISIFFDLSMVSAICIIASVAILYTSLGGIKAVIYTDILQFIIFVGGAIFAFFFIMNALPDGFSSFIERGSQYSKFNIEITNYRLLDSRSFFVGLAFGLVFGIAALGCDQDLMQRMLSVPTKQDAQKAMITSGIIDIPIALLFLGLGAALFVFYTYHIDENIQALLAHLTKGHLLPSNATVSSADRVFPYFIKTQLPVGMRGLLLAGLVAAAMSSLDSALNALSSSALLDLIKPRLKKTVGEAKEMLISRLLPIGFGLLLVLIAIMFGYSKSILWVGFQYPSYTYGAILGCFVLAIFFKKRVKGKLVPFAMVFATLIGFFATTIVKYKGSIVITLKPGSEYALLPWQYGILISTALTVVFSVLFSILLARLTSAKA